MRRFTEATTTRVKIIEIEIIIKVFMPYLDFVLYLCHDVRFKYFFFHSGFTDKVVKIFVIFILFAVRQAGFFCFRPYQIVNDSISG